jgi:hypothetical protein
MKLEKSAGGWEILDSQGKKFISISKGSEAIDLHQPGTHVDYFDAICRLGHELLRLDKIVRDFWEHESK